MMFNYAEIDAEKCEFVPVCSVEDVPEGHRLFVEIDEVPIVIFNISRQIFAIGDLCSHDDGPLGEGELEGFEISCPRHGARFDVRNGKALSLPAIVDIPAYPIRICDGQLEVGIPSV